MKQLRVSVNYKSNLILVDCVLMVSRLGIPPSILNSSNPGMGGATAGFGIGDGSPVANMTTAVSGSSGIEPFVGCIVAVAAIVVLGM